MNKPRIFNARIECWMNYETLNDEHNEYGTDVVELTKRLNAAVEKVAPGRWVRDEVSLHKETGWSHHDKKTGITYHMSVVEVKLVC